MKIQMITPSSLKILFNLKDLEENNISLHSFLSGSKSSKKFLKAIFEIAEEDLNIKISKNKFYYEIPFGLIDVMDLDFNYYQSVQNGKGRFIPLRKGDTWYHLHRPENYHYYKNII